MRDRKPFEPGHIVINPKEIKDFWLTNDGLAIHPNVTAHHCSIFI